MAELGLAGSELPEELRDGAGLDAAAQKSVQLLRTGVHLLPGIGNEWGIGYKSTTWSRWGVDRVSVIARVGCQAVAGTLATRSLREDRRSYSSMETLPTASRALLAFPALSKFLTCLILSKISTTSDYRNPHAVQHVLMNLQHTLRTAKLYSNPERNGSLSAWLRIRVGDGIAISRKWVAVQVSHGLQANIIQRTSGTSAQPGANVLSKWQDRARAPPANSAPTSSMDSLPFVQHLTST